MLTKKNELKLLSLWLPLLLFVLMAFAPQVQGQTDPAFGLNFSGDFRLRYENTTNQILGTPLPGGGSMQSDDGTSAGVILNFGIGHRFSEQLDVRGQIPTFFVSNAPGDATSVVPTFELTLGYRF